MNYFNSESKYLIRIPYQIPLVSSVFSGTESLKLLGLRIWELVTNEIKQLKSLGKFRNAIKNGNLHPALADYAKDIFIGLGFFKEENFYGMTTFSFSFLFVRFISLVLFMCPQSNPQRFPSDNSGQRSHMTSQMTSPHHRPQCG